MNIDMFWGLIEQGNNANEPEKVLEQQLANQPVEDLIAFQEIFDRLFDQAYQWELWGAAYLIGGGCSDDGFMDFRYGLIAKGKEVYEKALSDADSLAELGEDTEIENEMFGYVAQEVYQNATSQELPRADSTSAAEPSGDVWDFDDDAENTKRLPRLSAIHL